MRMGESFPRILSKFREQMANATGVNVYFDLSIISLKMILLMKLGTESYRDIVRYFYQL